MALLANHQQIELSEAATERITRVVRSLTEDRVERGVELGRPMHCDSCDLEKSPAGSAQYGAYQFCNDCLLDFTLALASGQADNAAEYMTKQPDGDYGPPSAELTGHHERHTGMNPLSARDKLVPRNEPC